MTDSNEALPEWSELDQTALRTGIRALIMDFPGDYRERVLALKQLDTIVREEIAAEMERHASRYLERHPRTLDGAREVVGEIDRDLADLHLVAMHPRTREACALAAAATPPPDPASGWVELVPLDAASRTPRTRLPEPMPALELTAEPARGHGRSRAR